MRSRFNSRLSSRFCSFLSCFVSFSAGALGALALGAGDDVDPPWDGFTADDALAVSEGDVEGIGFIPRGLNLAACDLNDPDFRSVSETVLLGPGIGVSLDLSLSRLGAIVGLALALLPGVALAVALAAGVALGTSNRPRRCDAVGATEADAEGTGLNVAEEVGVCCKAAARCGVIRGVAVAAAVELGATDAVTVAVAVAVAVADGTTVAVDVDVTEVPPA